MSNINKTIKPKFMRKAGRPSGAKNTVTSEKILHQIALQTGKPFEQLLAEGYHASIISCDLMLDFNTRN
jgi:hypothetical protein